MEPRKKKLYIRYHTHLCHTRVALVSSRVSGVSFLQLHGARKRWVQVADCLAGRAASQCRERWTKSLDPALTKGRWTAPEERRLYLAVRAHGSNFKQVPLLTPNCGSCLRVCRSASAAALCRSGGTSGVEAPPETRRDAVPREVDRHVALGGPQPLDAGPGCRPGRGGGGEGSRQVG